MEDKRQLKFESEQSSSFAKNVIMLAVAQIVVKILGLVYKIIIVNIPGFGNAGSGFYSTGFQIYLVLLAISSIGVPNVVSKIVAERITVGDYKGAHKAFKVSFYLLTFIGFILAALLFIFAKPLSVALFNEPGVAYTLMALAPAVVFVSMNSVLRGYFTGLGSLKSTSISEIIEQIFNCAFTILFVYLMVGKNTSIMAAAGNASTTVAALISLGYMSTHYFLRKKYIKIKCQQQTDLFENTSTKQIIKTVILLTIPTSFASLVSTLSGNIDSITVNQYTNDMSIYGLMSKTEAITHMPLAFGATLLVAMVPVISSNLSVGKKEEAEQSLSRILFISNAIMLPCTVGFIVLAQPILTLIYPNAADGANLLVLQSVAMIFSSVTFVLNGAFYGMGKQKFPAVILLIGTIIKLILNIVLLKYFGFGALGAVWATIVYQAGVTVAEWIILKKYMKVIVEFKRQLLLPIVASLIMGAIVFAIYKLISLYFGNTVSALSSIIVGVIVYLLLVLKFKLFTKEDYLSLPMGEKIYNILVRLKLS